MENQKKFQSYKEIESVAAELSRSSSWSLITRRDNHLMSRLYKTFLSQFPKERKELHTRRILAFIGIVINLIMFLVIWLVLDSLLFGLVFAALLISVIIRNYPNPQDLFMKKKAEVARLVKEDVDAEILDYEESIYKQQKELDALPQNDPLSVLTKKLDDKFGYMYPEQLQAYWQEVELPRRQKELQNRIEKWGYELAYIRKEYTLLEEIEKS